MSLKSWKQFTSPPKNWILSQEAMTKTAELLFQLKWIPVKSLFENVFFPLYVWFAQNFPPHNIVNLKKGAILPVPPNYYYIFREFVTPLLDSQIREGCKKREKYGLLPTQEKRYKTNFFRQKKQGWIGKRPHFPFLKSVILIRLRFNLFASWFCKSCSLLG